MVEHWSRKPGVVGSIPIGGIFSSILLAFQIVFLISHPKCIVYRRYRTLRSPLCKNSPNPETLNSARVRHTFLVLPDVRPVIRGANRRFHIIRRMRQTDGGFHGDARKTPTRRPSNFWRKKVHNIQTLELKPQRHQHVSPIHQ